MKSLFTVSSVLALLLCATTSHAASQDLQIAYTQLKNCKETVENPNAAYSELKCAAVGPYALRVQQAGAEYFGISLEQGAKKLISNFDAFPIARPAGQVIEWHSRAGEPVYMVLRIRYDEAGADKEVLTLSLVTSAGICPLAAVATSKNPQANQKVRDLIDGPFAKTLSCPTTIARY